MLPILLTTILWFNLIFALTSSFTESLDIRPIEGGLILTSFNFVQTIKDDKEIIDYGTFPAAIHSMTVDLGIEEMRISFGRGRWNYWNWGQIPFEPANSGIQLHSWLSDDDDVDGRWVKLTQTLSGLLCASLGLLNVARTTSPSISIHKPDKDNVSLRYGVLPREAVCTENLTPWVKMLPCMSNAGIALLLNPTKIYDSRFNLMDLYITRSNGEIKLSQNLYVVFDLLRWSGDSNWTFDFIFDRQITQLCPITKDTSLITVHFDEAENGTLEEWNMAAEDQSAKRIKYRGKGTHNQNIGISFGNGVPPKGTLLDSSILPVRKITGTGQEKGTVYTFLKNVSSSPITVTVLEVLPWYMKLYLNSLEVKCSNGSPVEANPLLYSPAIIREKPSQLEYQVEIPAQSSIYVEYDFDMTLLRYGEYPLDPNRGFDVNGALISYIDPLTKRPNKIVTNTMLLTLPTPDFTMPFNVIMLTSLAIVFFYGFFFNLCFRRFYLPDRSAPNPLQAIYIRITRRFSSAYRSKPKTD